MANEKEKIYDIGNIDIWENKKAQLWYENTMHTKMELVYIIC